MSKTTVIKVPAARWTIFDKSVLSTPIFGKAQIAWLSETAGKIIKRDAKGHFRKPEQFVVVTYSRR